MRGSRKTARLGPLRIGGGSPVMVQSMTNTDTRDIGATLGQIEKLASLGCEAVRVAVLDDRAAACLKELHDKSPVPLIADIHFDYRLAIKAIEAGFEGLRINPGNIGSRAHVDAVVDCAKANGACMRIGVNSGSVEKDLLDKYGGPTPEAMVESCMKHVRMVEERGFGNIVLSVKSSSVLDTIACYRCLSKAADYPLHLGVTEAGSLIRGTVKSAVGLGILLNEGIGDTIRVSLSEEPEAEIPVARELVDHFTARAGHRLIPAAEAPGFDWLHPSRRTTVAAANVGAAHVPVVITSVVPQSADADQRPDYIYIGSTMPGQIDPEQMYIADFNALPALREAGLERVCPIYPTHAMPFIGMDTSRVKFLVLQYGTPADEYIACLKAHPEVVVVAMTHHANPTGDQRALVHEMMAAGVTNPVVFAQMYHTDDKAAFQLAAAADMGALMIDGLTDGLWLMNEGTIADDDIAATAFAILQAARLRVSKTEYISCPGCGRTLYDLRATIARIKEATRDMKGLKIGIMGCIVNGPGEMADADYGYVGAGVNRVSLYRRQECVEKNIPEEQAVDHLLALIRKDQLNNQNQE